MLRLPLTPRCALLLALAATGCGRVHDLGVDTTTSATGTGGASSTSGSGGTGGARTTSTSSTTGTGTVDAGPPGPTELTIVNGVNDYDAVRFCFLPDDTPWPAATTGLAFAAGQVVAPISGPIPATSDVTPWVIAGDLAQTAGKTCAQILALAGSGADGGLAPAIVAQALPVIPQVVFDSHKSLLLVATGCLGGPGHDAPTAVSACGMGYTSTTPTASLVLVSMSRVKDPAHVSLQVVSASPALPLSDVDLLPNLMNATEAGIVGSLSQGAIGPAPPFAMFSVVQLGGLDGVKIDTFVPGTTSMQSSVTLGTVLAGSSLGASAFVDGASFVLVAVGSGPGLPAGAFWHALTYALVKAEPG